ncbi:hypothetical protein QCA50_006890 [Cerrena zonata]|uniref:Aminoglycoside phosphotransferase domain-containing protein n=1 Tax=Cerrena zonata TaxID=2478898 RepID=A0AAW0GBH2_9APHY
MTFANVFISSPVSTETLPDAELIRLYHDEGSRRVDIKPGATPPALFANPVKLITPDVVMKRGGEVEVISTNFVRNHTTIPVPRCGRIIHDPMENKHHAFVCTEYIPGCTLAECWEELGWWTRFRVIITLREYVRQLRNLRHTVPGPINHEACRGSVFADNSAGPFEDYAAFSAFFNRQYDHQKEYKPRYIANVQKPFDDSGPLVFSHHDMHMRNIILGEDGQLWLIDWDLAGFYPIFFEYCAIKMFESEQPASFNRWIPFVTGRWDGRGQWPFVRGIRWAMMVRRHYQ